MQMLRWFDNAPSLLRFVDANAALLEAQDRWVESQAAIEGWCLFCARATVFTVDTGVRLGAHINLREGMVCAHCGLNNRCRLLGAAAAHAAERRPRRLLLEALSSLRDRLEKALSVLEASEYFGPDRRPGELVSFRNRAIKHESILGFSMPDASLDLLIHNDILEHVPDLDAALRESRRVLRPSGMTVFCVPFFPFLAETQVRGRLRSDGTIEHLLPAEYHGDPLKPEGVYTFFHVGMDLFERARAAGFSRLEAGVVTDAFLGHPTNNHRYGLDEWVPAVVFRGFA